MRLLRSLILLVIACEAQTSIEENGFCSANYSRDQIEQLIHYLHCDPSDKVRVSAAMKLAQSSDPRAWAELRSLKSDATALLGQTLKRALRQTVPMTTRPRREPGQTQPTHPAMEY